MTPERWKRTEELYHAARARTPGERQSFLLDACPDDEALRRDVESLLREPTSAEGFLSAAALPAAPFADLAREAMAGRTLGGYHLRALLGAGGMGEVYRAHDTRLGREVALKILPRAFTNDPDRLARFEREARMLASLNHPNICAIYGVEEADGIRFLILELVEGQTLAQKLIDAAANGGGAGLPVHDSLTIARQIADALDAAHERGIIHRDLKPANITITADGAVKVLDFGLAKPLVSTGSPDITQAPSGASAGTREAAVIGTAAYMSPEQASGRPVDRRTDIWSFGVVVFEMVTGQRPFTGETVSETLASVLKSDPEWIVLPGGVTSELRMLLRRCLEKDPRRRLQSIADARVQVEDLLNGRFKEAVPSAVAQEFARASPHRGLRTAATIVAPILAVLIALAAGLRWASSGSRPIPSSVASQFHSVLLPPPGASLATEEAPAISRGGRRIAFVAYDAAGRRLLYARSLDSAAPPQALTNTEGASLPFWSPDDESIGFFAQGQLKTIHLPTGRLQRLAEAVGARGGTWNQDDVIVFVPSALHGPYRISARGGGDLRQVPLAAGTPPGGWFPSFLPDGRHFLQFVPMVSQPENSAIWVVSLETGRGTRLLNSRSHGIFAPPGYLLFWRDATLWAQAFDEATRQTRGSPMSAAAGVGLNPVTNQALFSVSDSGALVFFAGAVGESELVWMGRDGHQIGGAGPKGVITTVSLSPDAATVVYDSADSRNATMDLWQYVFARKAPERLTFDPSHDVFPLWSPDGTRIAFSSIRERPPQLYELAANAPGTEKLLLKTNLPKVVSGWSRDGQVLFYTVTNPTHADIWALPLGKDAYPVVDTQSDERYGTPSPDGRWLAYISNESGSYEVNVRALSGPGLRRQVSSNGGSQPQWRRDGRELFYMAPDKTLMSIAFGSSASTFHAAPAQALFTTRTKWIEIQGTARNYAAAPDGQRFLVANAGGSSQFDSITIVQNWTAALDDEPTARGPDGSR